MCVCACMCACLCACVCLWERERERERELILDFTSSSSYAYNISIFWLLSIFCAYMYLKNGSMKHQPNGQPAQSLSRTSSVSVEFWPFCVPCWLSLCSAFWLSPMSTHLSAPSGWVSPTRLLLWVHGSVSFQLACFAHFDSLFSRPHAFMMLHGGKVSLLRWMSCKT